MKLKPGFKVYIDAEALERIWHWTDRARGEFSCLGQTTDDVLVHDVQLFEQVCTSSSTEIDQDALAKFLCTHPAPEKVRAWIHSHGTLDVFWSEQDDACIEGLANETFLLSIVVNKKRQVKCRVDIWQPMRVTLDDLDVQIRVPQYGLKEECDRAFRDLVTEQHVLTAPGLRHGQQGGWQPQQRRSAVDQRWVGWDDDESNDWRQP